MPRYKLTIAYDGTEFHGWQKQEPDSAAPGIPEPLFVRDGRAILRTVQEVVEQAVRLVVREPISLQGASRTDAGVHALAQVACFTSEPRPEAGVGWPIERGLDPLRRALNSRLPGDILIRSIEVVPDAFDPIADCDSKAYAYTFHVGEERPLWDRRYVFHTWHALDADRMHAAAASLIGTHDFAAFAALNHGRHTTIRTIHECGVHEVRVQGAEFAPAQPPDSPRANAHHALASPLIRLHIAGNGFLYNMVRIIAGTLHEVGRGKIEPERVAEILASRDRRNAGPTLPPEGLRLEWIRYRPHAGNAIAPTLDR